ncbi:hypothetical protein ID866_8313 [Astraeus odoratus]|nr:hypothetical protein ID866_8313 [Astraeus odoratus]
MGISPLLLYIAFSIAIALVMLPLFWYLQSPDLSHIQTAGYPGFLGSCWTAIKFLVHGQKYLQEGYERYKPHPFKVLTLYGWLVILNREHLGDIANTSEADFSFHESANDYIKVEYTFGSEVYRNPYHQWIIQTQLSRNLASLCPDIKDEMVNVFSELITGNEWRTLPAFQSICQIISRMSNRVFVGLPLCRDPGWNAFNIALPDAVIKEALILRLFPTFIQPWIARYVTGQVERTRKGATYLGPMIEERQRHMDMYPGKTWLDKPNDFLQWCLDSGREPSVMHLTQRMMTMNFASIHTTTNTFTQALYLLAANPEYALLLREEVERIVEEDGWTKEALGKMRRIDSFLKETLRYQGTAWVTGQRKALKDIKLSDGTLIPKGTITLVSTSGIHHDPEVYDNADVFEPFRFADLGEANKYQLVAVNSASLSFGYGKVACPGRFFVAVILKLLLAHIVVSFDVKLDENGPQPKNLLLGYAIVADPKARVMFRRRSN